MKKIVKEKKINFFIMELMTLQTEELKRTQGINSKKSVFSKTVLCLIFCITLINLLYLFLTKMDSNHFDKILEKFMNSTL